MAKNMNDTSYRRLKVEELDDRTYHEENEENEGSVGPNEGTIGQLIQSQRWVDVLKELVKTAPLKAKDQVNLLLTFETSVLLTFNVSIYQFSRASRIEPAKLLRKL